jgi:hypothetical protein
MSLQVPIAVQKGTRPSNPGGISSDIWNIAEECWRANPWDRPAFPTVLEKLCDLARTEDVTPFTLREPRPMRLKGEKFPSDQPAESDPH